jgi:hypothetical protein
MSKLRCHKKWKSDGRFTRYSFRHDEEGHNFVPFCTYSGHIGLINDDRYRQKKCERNGGGKPCSYYRRLREEDSERLVYKQTNSIEVTIDQSSG